ncbi:hypothetical protein ABIA69_001915 [Lysinibacillus parviboronicapiens]|uniref:Uncharacterized protein n=1 Tax=Lysinibacillus parviboronicapiens TaxID=436516 RepID=A0ABV2PIL6_9BACI
MNKKTYNVHLKTGRIVEVESQRVVEKGGSIKFCNDRPSLADQYVNGPEIVASFNLDEVVYLMKQK